MDALKKWRDTINISRRICLPQVKQFVKVIVQEGLFSDEEV